jgi:hypothetical protein
VKTSKTVRCCIALQLIRRVRSVKRPIALVLSLLLSLETVSARAGQILWAPGDVRGLFLLDRDNGSVKRLMSDRMGVADSVDVDPFENTVYWSEGEINFRYWRIFRADPRGGPVRRFSVRTNS